MPNRKLIALLFCLLAGPALAGYMTLLGAGAGGVAPAAQGNFIQSAYSDNLSSLNAIATPTFSGLATQFDSTGTLTYRPNNLLTYSNTFSNAAWSLSTATLTSGISDPDDGTSAWTLTATGADALLFQNVTVPSTANGLFAVWVKRRTGSGTISLRQPSGAYTPITVTGLWAPASIVGPGNGAVNIAIQIATSGDAIDIYKAAVSAVTYETTPRAQDQVITTSAAYYGPRFDYTYNGSSWIPAGLLVEGAATNLAPQSQNFSSGYWANNSTRTIDATLASDGSTPSAKYTAAAGAGSPSWFNTSVLASVASGSNYAISLEIDGSSGAYPYLSFQNNTSTNYAVAVFNTTSAANGVATQTVTSGATIVSTAQTYLGNGRYRISMVASIAAIGTGAYIQPGLAKATTGNTVTNGIITATYAGTEYLYASFLQLEAGYFASSYIPTGASAVTRAAETVQLTGAALSTALGSVASAFVEVGGLPVQSGTIRYLQYGAGSGILLGMSGGSATTVYEQNTAGSALATAVAGSGSIATTLRAGVSWGSTGGRKLVANGGTVATDASNNELATGTVNLGQGQGTYINGWLRSFAIYNSRLPDATLQSKSVVGASYAANDNGIRYAFADNDNLPVHWRVAL